MTPEEDHALRRNGAVLSIDLGAIQRNYANLRSRVGDGTIAAVVKADAYGLGAVPVSRALLEIGCDEFFVATLDEAIALRRAVGDGLIYVLNGPSDIDADLFRKNNLIPIINNFEQLSEIKKINSSLDIGIHIDTGMRRFGFDVQQVPEVIAAIEPKKSQIKPAMVLSHFACADEPDHPLNRRQRELFGKALTQFSKVFPGIRSSLANSSGIFLGGEFLGDVARAGAALYGINPTPSQINPMDSVVRLRGRIAQLRFVDTLKTVGYGSRYLPSRGSIIATIPIGYADGLMRSLSNRGCAVVAGKSVPIVGRISMDSVMIDLSSLSEGHPSIGTPVDLIGPDCDIDQMAAHAGTIGYEVLTGLGQRIPKVYFNGKRTFVATAPGEPS